jgi:hypothetical protein
MIKLIVNDVELDLRSSTVVALTKKSVDIGNLQNRWSSYTNKFNIPPTKKNRDALGIRQFQDKSGAQYDYQNGKLISGGLEIASNVLVIIESVSDDIVLTLRAGNGTLFDRLNKTKLSDLGWDDLNHTWNNSFVWLYKDNDYTSGFVYPLHQTGVQSDQKNTIIPRGFIPFVYVKAAFERIASYFGYSFTGDTYTFDMFEKLTYPIASLKIGSSISNQYIFDSNLNSETFSTSITNSFQTYRINFTAVNDPKNSLGTYTLSYSGGATKINGTGYIVRLLGTYKIEFSYNVSYKRPNGSGTIYRPDLHIVLYDNKNLSHVTIIKTDLPDTTTDATITTSGTLSAETTITNINNDPTRYYLAVWVVGILGLQQFTVNSGTFEITEINATDTNFGGEIDMNLAQPDLTCGKFIKEVGNIFGAIYDVDEFNKKIEITRLDEIATNKAYAYDWSDKLDLNQSIDVTYKLDGIGKSTIWQWKEDIEYTKALIVDNDQLPEKAEYVKSDAEYTFDSIALTIPHLIYNVPLWNGKQIQMDEKFRFAMVKNDDNLQIIFPLSGNNTTTATNYKVAYFSYPGSPYSLDWEDLYDLYYADLLDPMTERIQRVECYVRLNDLDIQSFRFKYPVYIKHFNRYFFVDEISEYTGKTQSTKVILVGI